MRSKRRDRSDHVRVIMESRSPFEARATVGSDHYLSGPQATEIEAKRAAVSNLCAVHPNWTPLLEQLA